MEERRKKLIIGSLLLIGGALVLYSQVEQPSTATFTDENGTELATITYETAATPEETRRGLMYREELEKNHGMIFVYEHEAPRSFWMKNTLIPLDIIFIDSNKEIINIEKAYPEPNTSDSDLRRYSSDSPAQYVIEVNQNFTERNEIEKGDRVRFTLSR